MRHDILKWILCRIAHRAGVASTLEPTLRRQPGLQAGVAAPAGGGDIGRLEGRGDVLIVLGTGIAIVDVSMTHPAGVANKAAAAASNGAAAAKRDVEKRRAYNRWSPTATLSRRFQWRRMAGWPSQRLLCLGVWV
jgi:hypothetical protein